VAGFFLVDGCRNVSKNPGLRMRGIFISREVNRLQYVKRFLYWFIGEDDVESWCLRSEINSNVKDIIDSIT
jgi:hypothetical protein